MIKVESGKIKCGDFWSIGDPGWSGAEYEIDNGFYRVCFYLKDIRDRFFGFVVVLSKATSFNNDIKEIEQVG